jgi:dipeptidyl aminopeptidase/acylaminoacyl peptidase
MIERLKTPMKRFAWMMVLFLLAACQSSSEPEVVPTLIDLNAIATNDAATAIAAAATADANRPPTLPPTWTPTPEADVQTGATPPPATPPGSAGSGMIFYVFNGDSIVRLLPDGSFEELIRVGGAPSDLSVSPDGSLLAYVAQGSGSAREVFVSSPDGSYTQQVSCLGFSRVVDPTWSFDGQTLAFAASQTPDGVLGIYVADFAGSGQCPTGNNQRQIVQLEENRLYGLAWNPAKNVLFFSAGAISAVNLADGSLYPGLIPATGFGPNLSPAHHPTADRLLYLKAQRDSRTGQIGGAVYEINTAALDRPQEIRGIQVFARSLRWSSRGSYLLLATERDVWLQDERTGSSLAVVEGSNFYPQPAISPDETFIAYVDGGQAGRTVPQVYIVGRDGRNPTQITTHQEGSITDLMWAAG